MEWVKPDLEARNEIKRLGDKSPKKCIIACMKWTSSNGEPVGNVEMWGKTKNLLRFWLTAG